MATREYQGIRGEVTLVLREAQTARVLRRVRAKNAILATGSELVACRFCSGDVPPIAAVGVGTSADSPGETSLTDLVAPVMDDAGASRAVIAPVEPGAPLVRMEGETAVVEFKATFDPSQGVGELREAGIFNTAGTLYNRVVFEVINKGSSHELTLLWRIAFGAGTAD